MRQFLLNATLLIARRLYANRMRTGTSLLGMAIAVASLIIMVSIGDGAREHIRDLVAAEGVNVVYVVPGLRNIAGVRTVQGTATTLTVQDAIELKSELPQLRETCWWRQDPSRVVYGRMNWFSRILAISPGCQIVKGWVPESGRSITQSDFDGSATVALIGQTVVRRMFPDQEPIGSTIRIQNLSFKVIGVLEEKGYAPGGYDQDDLVLVPYSTARNKMLGPAKSSVEVIAVSTYVREELPQVAPRMRDLLRSRHRLSQEQSDDFTIRTQMEVEKIYQGANDTLSAFLAIIAAFSLLVGGVGIANLLISSVVDRTKEIGISLAVGAKRWHILCQFAGEALALGLFGGVVGALSGMLLSYLLQAVTNWPVVVSVESIAVGVTTAIAVGLLAGLYPSMRAASLNPIDALRHE